MLEWWLIWTQAHWPLFVCMVLATWAILSYAACWLLDRAAARWQRRQRLQRIHDIYDSYLANLAAGSEGIEEAQ